MGLEQVIGEVQDGGERRAQEILDDARSEAEGILAAAREKVAELESQRAAQTERDIEQMRAQTVSHAEFEARKRVLETEAELRKELRSHLLDGLAALPAATRKQHLEQLLAQAAGIVPSGRVWGAEADKDILAKSDYTFADTLDVAGGLIVESEDGMVRLDLTYETLVDDRWRDILRAEAELFA